MMMNKKGVFRMKKDRPVSFIASLLVILSYLSFALLALWRFPGSYSPLNNWLSDLGSPKLNPQGAIFYNLGIIATGLLLLPFFLGFTSWKMEGFRVQNAMLALTCALGLLGGLAMIMSAVFPIDHIEQHRFWSISLYFLLGTAFVFSVAALRYDQRFPRWALGLGIVTGVVDILSGMFHDVYLLEWITTALFLGYIFILGIKTRAVNQDVSTQLGSRPKSSAHL
jgi:hypothetical membrane protein